MQSSQGGSNANGRPNLRIAHRRTPSELTPLMLEQYQIQQQIELLQAQQAMLQSQQAGLSMGPPAMMPQQYGYNQSASAHRRGQSMSQSNAGPPPAPSSGASGFTEVTHQRRSSQSGHNRRHSLALPEAKRAAEKAQAIKQNPGFSFPGPSSSGSTGQSEAASSKQSESSSPSKRNASPSRRNVGHNRSQSMAGSRIGSTSPVRGSNAGFQFPPSQSGTSSSGQDGALGRSSSGGHGRQSSRNFDSNWRAGPPVTAQDQQPYFTPGHRSRASMSSSVSSLQNFGQNFAYANVTPNMHNMLQPLNSMSSPQMLQQQQQMQNANAQNRKSLFSPYLPQATLPALLSDGSLVAGFLRVNKKNRSDAYVSTDLLDEDIFICGSKDRNRALESDYVAIELLDVDEVWSAKRDKEDKKKRKDNSGMSGGGLRRQGSIRDRPEAKKKDDVEVEGQGLLLVDEEEVNDEQKPIYAGHVVAVIERTAGQMFSGTLGLLRPSSAATKEKQEAERRDRDGCSSSSHRQAERPKIVWFKPTDKRVPLIAIPTEQAPRDFVENHEHYKNRIFVACIKRWPITSLHPFGTLVEELGNMGDVSVETEALLRDNSFLAEEFSSTAADAVAQIAEGIDIEGEGRKDFRGERAFAIASSGNKEITDAFHIRKTDDGYEVGVHITDANHFIRPGHVLDREAKKRGCAVNLVERTIPMLPASLTEGLAAFGIDADRRAISIVFKISSTYQLEDSWIGKSIIRNTAIFTYPEVEQILAGESDLEDGEIQSDITALHAVSKSLFQLRYPGGGSPDIATLKLFHQLDHEERNPSPVSANIFEQKPANNMVDELLIRANITVAELLVEKLSSAAMIRKQSPSNKKKLDQLVLRGKRLGVAIDPRSIVSIVNSIAEVQDLAVRKALEICLVKACKMPRYIIAGNALHPNNTSHFGFNVPVYTHFTSPFNRYSDLVAHRQLAAALEDQPWNEDLESLNKQADFCNTKKDAAKNAQDQSIHLMLCSMVDKLSATSGAVIRQAIVINVMDSSFDVLLPEFGAEKRVHLDQLPLHKAEFNATTRKLELFWMKGVDSATWIPADQQGKGTPGHMRGASIMEEKMIAEKMMEISSLTIEDESTLFTGERLEATNTTSKSVPSSPPKRPSAAEARPASSTAVPTMADLNSSKEKPAFTFEGIDRRANGDVVQEITELSRVPVVLQADCVVKSPPLLLVRAINPARD